MELSLTYPASDFMRGGYDGGPSLFERGPGLSRNGSLRSLPAARQSDSSMPTSLPSATGVFESSVRGDPPATTDVSALMAAARASLETRDVPPPPSVPKLPREIDRSANMMDSAGGPPPPMPHLTQVPATEIGHAAPSSVRRQLPPPLAPSLFGEVPRAGIGSSPEGATLDAEASFAVSSSANAAPWRSMRSPPDHASLFSTTASRAWSKADSPRHDKALSFSERLRIEMDATEQVRHDFYQRGRQQTHGLGIPVRSTSMPPEYRLPVAPVALPMVPGLTCVGPLTVASVPVSVSPCPVAMCNTWAAGVPPPLPPVPVELRARLDALEQEVCSPSRSPDTRLVQQQTDMALSNELREELRQAQEGERRSREEMERRYQDVIAENNRLRSEIQSLTMQQQFDNQQAASAVNKDVQELRDAKLAEQRSREELESRHQEVLADHNRLKEDYHKLSGDHAAEQQARQEVARKHAAVESDAQRLQADLQRLQQAHEDELHCTKSEWQRKHREAEEASERVLQDMQKMQADKDAEKRARAELERKHQEVLDDAARLRADYERMETDRDAEVQARKDVQQKHREVEDDSKKLKDDLQHWQERHSSAEMERDRVRTDFELQLRSARDDHQRTREDLEGRHRVTAAEVERLRSALARATDEASATSQQLKMTEFRVQELTVALDREKQAVQNQVNVVDEQRGRLRDAQLKDGSLRIAEEKIRSSESQLASAQVECQSLQRRLLEAENERDDLSFENSRLLNAEKIAQEQIDGREQSYSLRVTNVERTYEERISAMKMEVQSMREQVRESEVLRVQLQREKASLEQLQSDFKHVQRANEQREESERSLRSSLEQERITLRDLQVQVERSNNQILDLQAENRSLKDSAVDLHGRRSGAEQEVEEMSWKLQAAEAQCEVERNSSAQFQQQISQLRVECASLESRVKLASSGKHDEQVEDLQRKLWSVEAERDSLRKTNVTLSSDLQHLKNAGAEREQSESALRHVASLEHHEIDFLKAHEGDSLTRGADANRRLSDESLQYSIRRNSGLDRVSAQSEVHRSAQWSGRSEQARGSDSKRYSLDISRGGSVSTRGGGAMSRTMGATVMRETVEVSISSDSDSASSTHVAQAGQEKPMFVVDLTDDD